MGRQVLAGRFGSSIHLLLFGGVLVGCSGKIETIDRADEPDGAGGFVWQGSGGTTSTGGRPQTGGSGGTVGIGGSFPSGGAPPGSGGQEPFIEPECPDQLPPEVVRECDPLDALVGCDDGLGCYPFLSYPESDDGCGFATFGAVCAPASVGEQGDFCGADIGYCSPGFMCVVGAAGGKRCGQICETIPDHQCPDGLICGKTDVQGYGVCF